MAGPSQQAELDAALEPMRQQLRLDGYDLTAAFEGGHILDVTVVALPEACVDCLVPRDLMAAMIADQVGGGGITVDEVRVTYPADG